MNRVWGVEITSAISQIQSCLIQLPAGPLPTQLKTIQLKILTVMTILCSLFPSQPFYPSVGTQDNLWWCWYPPPSLLPDWLFTFWTTSLLILNSFHHKLFLAGDFSISFAKQKLLEENFYVLLPYLFNSCFCIHSLFPMSCSCEWTWSGHPYRQGLYH